MKKQLIYLFAFLLFAAFSPARLGASVAVSQEKTQTALAEKAGLDSEKFSKLLTNKKTEKRLDRFVKKLERKAEKRGKQIDFSDPVDQWLWFGVFGLAAAIAFAILDIGFLAGLCALAALVCLIIWIVKRGAV